MYSQQKISQNSFPNFIAIFPKLFMIIWQELVDATTLLSAFDEYDPKRNDEIPIQTWAPKDVIAKIY
jgi:hypothetical protein